jgi:predicted ATPase
MLTLIGPGGCGKTRLAIETLAGIDPLPDGIWFVELAGLSDGALVAQATALAVGVPIPAQRSAQEALAAHLAARQAIVVLDNCEHVIDACARLAEDLLRAGPGVRVLATSREPLRCEGEVAWRVPSLAEAERLFVERALAADPGFAAGDDATTSTCSRAAAAPRAPASRRCGRRSSGATTCSRARSASSSVASPCSPAASHWKPRRTSAPAARSRAGGSWTSSRGWSTSRS